VCDTVLVAVGDDGLFLVSGTAALIDLLADSPALDAAPTLRTLFGDLPEAEATTLISSLETAARVIEPQAVAYRNRTGGNVRKGSGT
jgi:MarR family 2-MHQ and catechol resistance regulon transcriptional repressor